MSTKKGEVIAAIHPTGRAVSPWRLDVDRNVIFTTLPHIASDAVIALCELFIQMAPERYARLVQGVAPFR